MTAWGTRVVLPLGTSATSSGTRPSRPCLWKRRRRSRTVSMWVWVSSARCLGGTIGKQDQRTDHFVAPLQAIDEVELQLGKIFCRVHACSPLLTSALHLPPRAMHAGVLPR